MIREKNIWLNGAWMNKNQIGWEFMTILRRRKNGDKSTAKPFTVLPLIFLLIFSIIACDKKDHSPAITKSFTGFIKTISNGEFDKLNDYIHPDSPFLKTGNIDEIENFWAMQHLKITSVGGKIKVLAINGGAKRAELKYEIAPDHQFYDPVQVAVNFARIGHSWKVFIKDNNFDLVPISPGNVKIKYEQDYDLGEGRRMKLKIKSEKIKGPGVDDWIKLIKARDGGQTGYTISDITSKTKPEKK